MVGSDQCASSLIQSGAFARKSIPAKGKNYTSDGVKKKLGLLGKSLNALQF